MESEIFLSSNGYDFLESYTRKLYKERGTFRHNLERYLHGSEFINACRNPENIDQIPEITFENIQNQAERETHFNNLCSDLMKAYAQRTQNDELTDDDYYEIAGIMGLCPGQCDWHETLFPHLVDLFVSSEEEGQEILDSVKQHPNLVALMVDVMSDGIRSGQIINYNGRNLWSQGYARNYFRGENAYNKHCRPTLFRNMPDKPEEIKIHGVIRRIQMLEFSIWINNLSFVRNWPFGDVFHGAIAQHYGILTNGIDITSDFETALFFACCKYENGEWRPLREKEFEYADSRADVIKRGGDSRFGIIFTAPADISNMSHAANIPELHFTGVTPVGFQPFMRCSNQRSYIIEAGETFDLYNDLSFSKFKFRHKPEICDWIYSKMQSGDKIYPNEIFGNFIDIVENVQRSKRYSEKAFKITLERMQLESEEDKIKEALGHLGYQCTASLQLCSNERMAELESSWNNVYNKHEYFPPDSPMRLQFCI